MTEIDINGRQSGAIWLRKIQPRASDGLTARITHTQPGLTQQGKHIRYVRLAFNHYGNSFIAGDQLGDIYLFNLTNNRFSLIQRTGQACTALAFNIKRPTEILVALADYTVRCYDTDSHEQVACLKGHDASIKSFSLHPSGRLLLAVSSRDAVLWDLDCFARKRTLNGGQDVGVQDVFFLPLSNTILTIFKDDTIHGWETDTLEYKYQVGVIGETAQHFRSFAATQDGRLLVAGGRTRLIHLWTMETRKLLRVIQLPAKVRSVKQLLFLPNNFDGGTSEVLGVLAQDGILRFINVHSCKLLFQVGSHDEMVSYAQASCTGSNIAAVSEKGDLLLYSVSAITSELQQPPAPLLRVVKEATTGTSNSSKGKKAQTPHKVTTTGHRSATPHKNTSRSSTVVLQKNHTSPVEKTVMGVTLDVDKLKAIVKGYGEYPHKYRCFIWRFLLQLPDNHTAYSSLLDKGTHHSYANLHEVYPIKSRKLLRVLQRALSALAHWAPVFGETSYLPELVFPFVKLFQNNQLATFEILATVLMNWCAQWFEYFPNPPLNVLAMVENLLAHHDAELLEHFVRHSITTQMYAWPLLQTLFSEVLTRDEWLRIWDNIFSNHPGYLILAVTSYLTCSRHSLLQCATVEDFEFFFHHQNAVHVGGVISEAYRMMETTPTDLNPVHLLQPFVPLSKGSSYPVFNKYPSFIVDYQVQERERIRQEESEYLRQRQSALELERMTEQRRHEEEAWYRQQQLLVDAEQQRREMIAMEEQKLLEQRKRLQAMKRELRVKELKMLDEARQRFMHHHQQVKEAELKRLDDEVKRKVLLREEETKMALDDADIKAVELDAQKALLEQELLRKHEEALQLMRANAIAHGQQEDLERGLLERAMEEGGVGDNKELLDAQSTLGYTQLRQANLKMQQEIETLQQLNDLKREMDNDNLLQKSQAIAVKQKQITTLAEGLKDQEKTLLKERGKLLTSTRMDQVTDDNRRLGKISQLGREKIDFDPTITSTDTTKSNVVSDTVTSDEPASTDLSVSSSWAKRRETLDRQEAELLSRVRGLRQRVIQQSSLHSGDISSRNTSYSTGPLNSVVTHTTDHNT